VAAAGAAPAVVRHNPAAMAPFSIRPAVPTDVPLIRDLIGELAEYERLAHEARATDALLHEHLFGARPAAEAVIAEAGGEPAGFALFFTSFSTFEAKPGIWLEDLFVRPAHRRAGIGRALLAHLAALALERGCVRFEWAALDWNEPALAFYRSLDARAMPEWVQHRLDGDALARLARRS
jgi:GNAT superfamily N-acetyltransferase